MKAAGEFCYRAWLLEQIQSRKLKNPAFSLRAFAKTIGLSSSHLSNIISAKRPLTAQTLEKILRRLSVSPQMRQRLRSAVDREVTAARAKPTAGGDLQAGRLPYREIEDERFQLIARWYYFAILGLAAVRPNKAQASWISRRLQITTLEARAALNQLLRLGYIEETSGGGFQLASEPILTKKDFPSQHVRNFHRQLLDLAHRSLDLHSVDERYFSFRGIACSPELLGLVKEEARAFQERLITLLHQGSQAKSSVVHALNIHFFPIDQGGSNVKI